jgi:short-subunit dehydrogenase
MAQKKVIVIGASSGIGREIANIYVALGWKVGITGRRFQLLNELQSAHPSQVVASTFDVMGNENKTKLSELIEDLGGMNILIYNSGFGESSKELDPEIEQAITRTNVNGCVEIVSYAFNYFANKGSGHIVLTSSVAALRGNGWSPAYSASKAFMSNYAEGLNIKASKMKKDILVTDIRPGFVDTKMGKGPGRFWVAPAEKAARQIVDAITKKKRVAYVTRRWWLIAQLLKIIPFSLYRRLG